MSAAGILSLYTCDAPGCRRDATRAEPLAEMDAMWCAEHARGRDTVPVLALEEISDAAIDAVLMAMGDA